MWMTRQYMSLTLQYTWMTRQYTWMTRQYTSIHVNTRHWHINTRHWHVNTRQYTWMTRPYTSLTHQLHVNTPVSYASDTHQTLVKIQVRHCEWLQSSQTMVRYRLNTVRSWLHTCQTRSDMWDTGWMPFSHWSDWLRQLADSGQILGGHHLETGLRLVTQQWDGGLTMVRYQLDTSQTVVRQLSDKCQIPQRWSWDTGQKLVGDVSHSHLNVLRSLILLCPHKTTLTCYQIMDKNISGQYLTSVYPVSDPIWLLYKLCCTHLPLLSDWYLTNVWAVSHCSLTHIWPVSDQCPTSTWLLADWPVSHCCLTSLT
jgi:hypothetical protein